VVYGSGFSIVPLMQKTSKKAQCIREFESPTWMILPVLIYLMKILDHRGLGALDSGY